MSTHYATLGSYVLLGASAAVIVTCRAIEWLNYQAKVTPRQRLRVGK